MMEEMLLLLLCWHLFSLLQRTLSKREDQSSDCTSTVWWFGSSPGKKHLFNYASCVFCIKYLLTKTENVPLLCLWDTDTCRTGHILHLPGYRDVLFLMHPFSGLLSLTSLCHDGGSQCQVPWASCYLVHAAGVGGFHSRKGLNTISQLLQEHFTVRLLHKRQVISPPPPLPAFCKETSS